MTPAQPLMTARNSKLSVPAATIASALGPGVGTLTGSNFVVSAVAPQTQHGGRVMLRGSQEWVRRYDGDAGSSRNAAYAALARRDGSVVVSGGSLASGTQSDFATVCYASDGTPLWTNRYDGPGHGDDTPRWLGTDASGNVWVAGVSERYATNWMLTDVVTIKYASNGVPVWTNRYSSFVTNDAYPTALAVDSAGNAYLAHWATYWDNAYSGTPVDSAITKYDAAGNTVWTMHFPVSAPDSGAGLHDVEALALDGTGKLLVAGMAGSEHYVNGTSLVKFDGDGAALWTNYLPRQIMSVARLVAADRQGNVILTGESSGTPSVTYVVLKCSVEGVSLWTNVLTGPMYDGGNVPRTIVDTVGDVFVVGGKPGTAPGLYQVLKFSGDGSAQWTNLTADFGVTNSMIYAAAADGAGNLFLAGHAPSPESTELDYVTIKYSADGNALWTNRFNGSADLEDIPFDLAVDGTGNVYVTGRSESAPGRQDYATVKYSDMLVYTPPPDFTGSDTITCTLADDSGNRATVDLGVVVAPVSFQFNLSATGTGVTPDGMWLQVDGAPGTNAVVIEASTDLALWQPLSTNAPVNGSVRVLDPSAMASPRRFYRARQPQISPFF